MDKKVSKLKIGGLKYYPIFIIALLGIVVAGILVAYGFHVKSHFDYNFQTQKAFSVGLVNNKEFYESIIVLNPNFKPDFVIDMDKHLNVLGGGSGLGWLVPGAAGIFSGIVTANSYDSIGYLSDEYYKKDNQGYKRIKRNDEPEGGRQ